MVGDLLPCGGVGDCGESAAGQDLTSEVAANLSPFINLLGHNCADETNNAGPVGEDPGGIDAATDSLLSRSVVIGRFQAGCLIRSMQVTATGSDELAQPTSNIDTGIGS